MQKWKDFELGQVQIADAKKQNNSKRHWEKTFFLETLKLLNAKKKECNKIIETSNKMLVQGKKKKG